MHYTVIGTVRDPAQLDATIAAIENAGFAHRDISLLGQADVLPQRPTDDRPASGGAAAYLATLGEVAIPGFGPLIAAGALLSSVTGNAPADDTTTEEAPGLVRRLMDFGVDREQARRHEQQVREGGILVAVHAKDAMTASDAEEALAEVGALDVAIAGRD